MTRLRTGLFLVIFGLIDVAMCSRNTIILGSCGPVGPLAVTAAAGLLSIMLGTALVVAHGVLLTRHPRR